MKTIPLIDLLDDLFPEIPRKELYARVMCGEVFSGDECIKDPRQPVKPSKNISFGEKPYVSRGGMKLEAALRTWDLPVQGKKFLDAGSSTGGFTDCLLKHGVRLVHAVDVGYNQLDYRLRRDDRVLVYERTNIMDVRSLDPVPDAAVADLSFRSIRKAASHIIDLTYEKWMVALVKPQFEHASRMEKNFTGIVKSEDTLRRILSDVVTDLNDEGIIPADVLASPILGQKGNREFLFLFFKEQCTLPKAKTNTLEELIETAIACNPLDAPGN